MKAYSHLAVSNRSSHIKEHLEGEIRRLWAGSDALEMSYGGVSAAARATGLMPKMIQKGGYELTGPPPEASGTGRQRSPGGARKPLTAKDPALAAALEKIMEPLY